MIADGLIWAASHYTLASRDGWHNAKPTDLLQWFTLPAWPFVLKSPSTPPEEAVRRATEHEELVGEGGPGAGTETSPALFILDFLDSY